MLQLFALAHEPRAVEDDEQGAAGVHRRRPDRRHFAERGQRHAADDEGDAEEKVLVDHHPRALREL